MKIGGPKAPGDTDAVKAPKAEPRKANEAGVAFGELLDGAAAPASKVSSAIAELAAQIRSGDLSVEAAAAQLVDRVMHRRAAALDPAAQRRLREHLTRLLTEDPMLVASLDRIGRSRNT